MRRDFLKAIALLFILTHPLIAEDSIPESLPDSPPIEEPAATETTAEIEPDAELPVDESQTATVVEPAPEQVAEVKEESNEVDLDAPLPSPTENFEAYIDARRLRSNIRSTPVWSSNINVVPRAFPSTDLRRPPPSGLPAGRQPTQVIPKLRGVLLGADRYLFQGLGSLSFGLQLGVYGSANEDGYSGMSMALISGSPYIQYQLKFARRQFLVPTGRVEEEFIRQNYKYEGGSNRGLTYLTRFSAGVLLFLNPLEPSEAANMSSDYGIKNVYLAAYLSVATDPLKKNIDLTDRSWRFALRLDY